MIGIYGSISVSWMKTFNLLSCHEHRPRWYHINISRATKLLTRFVASLQNNLLADQDPYCRGAFGFECRGCISRCNTRASIIDHRSCVADTLRISSSPTFHLYQYLFSLFHATLKTAQTKMRNVADEWRRVWFVKKMLQTITNYNTRSNNGNIENNLVLL